MTTIKTTSYHKRFAQISNFPPRARKASAYQAGDPLGELVAIVDKLETGGIEPGSQQFSQRG